MQIRVKARTKIVVRTDVTSNYAVNSDTLADSANVASSNKK